MKVHQLMAHLRKLDPNAEIQPYWEGHVPSEGFGGVLRDAQVEGQILLDCGGNASAAAWDLPGTLVVRVELRDGDGLVSTCDGADKYRIWTLPLSRRPGHDWRVVAVYDDGRQEPVYFVPRPELFSEGVTELQVDLGGFHG